MKCLLLPVFAETRPACPISNNEVFAFMNLQLEQMQELKQVCENTIKDSILFEASDIHTERKSLERKIHNTKDIIQKLSASNWNL